MTGSYSQCTKVTELIHLFVYIIYIHWVQLAQDKVQ
jgi:hypothetical protein